MYIVVYLFSRSTIKNSKGQFIASSVRDKSRELRIYKKLSEKKSKEEAEAVAKKVGSSSPTTPTTPTSPTVRFQMGEDEEESVDGGGGGGGGIAIKRQAAKQQAFAASSVDSYEYIGKF